MCEWLLGQALCWCKKTKSLTLYRFANKVGDRKAFIYICPVHFIPQCIYITNKINKYIYTFIYVDIFSFLTFLGFYLFRKKVDNQDKKPTTYILKGFAGVHFAFLNGIMSGHNLKRWTKSCEKPPNDTQNYQVMTCITDYTNESYPSTSSTK